VVWERLDAIAADAGVPVHMLGRVSDELMRALFQRALAFVFPPVEDFGIIPVEAMATGCPVIVNRIGGAAESAVDGVAGAHYDPDDASGYRAAIDLATGIRPEAARARALAFDTARFVDDVRDWVLGGPAQAGASSRPNSVSSALG